MTALAADWNWGGEAADPGRCAAMLMAQERYGPDDFAAAELGGAAMGRRLARLLPEDPFDAGPQTGRDGRLLMVADARLDDRHGVAAALGRSDHSRLSDAELLLRAWERWDEGALDKVAGDYALIVFDRDAGVLTVARDALGGRPLFWRTDGGRVAVASMPAGLHAAGAPRRADPLAAARLLAALPARNGSFFAGVRRVEPGCLVRFDAGGGVEVRRHWHPSLAELRLPRFTDYVDAYRERLDRAVAARLRRAAGPAAAQLSGGWDSGAVAATAARLLAPEPLIAYTHVPRCGADASSVPHRFADEGPLAASVAAMHPGIDHRLIEGRGESPLAAIGTHPGLFGRPLVNLCNHVWLNAIRDDARASGVRVLLTGEIGNYTISSAPATLLADLVRRGRWGAWARESVAAVRQRRARVRGVLATSFGPWVPPALWRRLERFSAGGPGANYSLLRPEWRTRLAGETAEAERDARSADYAASTLARIRTLDVAELRKGVLARWGVEERDPTADRGVVEFTLSLPPDMFLKHGIRRPLARSALADRLPAAVLAERRKGYQGADWHEGLTADLANVRALADRIAADPVAREVIDVGRMRALLDRWPTGDWSDPAITAQYRIALIRALSVGSFVAHG